MARVAAQGGEVFGVAQRSRDMHNLGLASMGAVLEYFDFQVYVFVAAALSQALFPPGGSAAWNQIQAFGIYAIGYLVRPIAGMTIAHYADRIGRKKLFIFTVLLMSVPTLLMGLLPTYAQAGWLAPAALLVLRVLQGCAVGGELPGAGVFISEHAKPGRLRFSSGFYNGVVNCGLLLGAGAAALAKYVAGLDPSWTQLAWRLPFILGGLFGLLAAYLRRHLEETPMFEEIRRERRLSREVPLAAVLRGYRWPCVFAVALVFVFSTTSGVYFQWLPNYLTGQLHFSADVVFRANVVGILLFVLGMPAWGALGDRFGWSALLTAAAVVNSAVALWFFHALPGLAPGDERLVWAMAAVGLFSGIIHAHIAGLISALFPTAIRQSGFAFPYSVGTAVFTGLTPLNLAWLSGLYGLAAPVGQVLVGAVVSLALALAVRRLSLFLGPQTRAGGAALSMPAAEH